MLQYCPLRELPSPHQCKPQDVLVVFGELFQRGYVNGIVSEARRAGMAVVTGTMGRREKDNTLRPLSKQELTEKPEPEKIINIPLEAGFDLEKASSGQSPVDQLQGIKLPDWKQVQLNWKDIEESRQRGEAKFRQQTKKFLEELKSHIPNNANVLFVHTMAGGFPRARIVMPLSNKIFKGAGDRYASSQEFWNSDMGQLCEKSFHEVTCNTFKHLIEESTDLRNSIEARGNKVSYVAYGYHGTEILIGEGFKWQSYSPYLQGWAKLGLENVAQEKSHEGIQSAVYNVPEILTNSSSIFLGVEIPLYRLLASFKKLAPHSPLTQNLIKKCQSLLKSEHTLESLDEKLENYFQSEVIAKWSQFDAWPQHNGPEQMELMKNTATEIIQMHKSKQELMTAELSEIVFKACGQLILDHIGGGSRHQSPSNPSSTSPITWIGHDLITQTIVASSPSP